MFLLVLPGLAGLYLLIEGFEKLDDLMEAGVDIRSGLIYFSLSVPRITADLAPMAVLLAGMLAVMLLSRHSEMLALRTLGIGPWRIAAPFLAMAGCIAAAMLFAQASLIPAATARAQFLWQTEVKKSRPRGTLQDNRLFFHGEKAIWTTELDTPDARRLRNVEWIAYDTDFTLKTMIASSTAQFSAGEWTFRHGLKQSRPARDAPLSLEYFESLSLPLPETPEDFIAVERPPDQMSLASLRANVKRLKQAGYPAREQETLLWSLVLYPFLGCSLLAAGLPLTFRGRRGGLATGLALGTLLGFGAWIFWNLAVTVAKTGNVSPLAPLTAIHLVLIATGSTLMRRLRF